MQGNPGLLRFARSDPQKSHCELVVSSAKQSLLSPCGNMRLLRFARNDGETSVGLLRGFAPRDDPQKGHCEVVVSLPKQSPKFLATSWLRKEEGAGASKRQKGDEAISKAPCGDRKEGRLAVFPSKGAKICGAHMPLPEGGMQTSILLRDFLPHWWCKCAFRCPPDTSENRGNFPPDLADSRRSVCVLIPSPESSQPLFCSLVIHDSYCSRPSA